MNTETIAEELSSLVGNKNILIDYDSRMIYAKDRTQNLIPDPSLIVFPRSESQIISIVQWANHTRTALVPSGGRTGYSGGAVAQSKEVVVSFDKMNHILAYNSEDQTVRCQPGVITKNLQNFALENNLYYPVDFASSGSSQIGGNIATNAGGIKVIRYGLTRNWVYGLNVVTGNGDLLHLNKGLIKNASGYDLRHLFIGSEGTLGIITEAIIKLSTLPSESKVALLGVQEKNTMVEILNIYRKDLQVTAFEFFSEAALKHVMCESNISHPFKRAMPFYILLEYESSEFNDEVFLGLTESCINSSSINDAIISQNMAQYKYLWSLRENISMSLSKYLPYKYDISVMPSKIPVFIEEIEDLLNKTYPDFEIIWFGHIGDGNLHLNILKPVELKGSEFFEICDEMSDAIYSLVNYYNGSISAEHGIGLLKKKFLRYTKNDVEIGYMREIKKIFDKNNIMNPGKIFDDS
ncbi:MAG: FAD-binding oxidoreductase [Legionellales bacterium]|nr:FAD-binding oxidoreductase [Legionellales bacterium]